MGFLQYWKKTIHKNVKRILSNQSHLAPYIPIIKQTKLNKFIRIYDDHSVEEDIDTAILLIQNKKEPEQILNKSFNPISTPSLLYYILVFIALIFTYTQTWLMYTYGKIAWEDSLAMTGFIVARVYSIVVFSIDIYAQMNLGYLFRGMIIMDSQRIKNRYFRYFLFIDVFLIFSLVITLITKSYDLNYLKVVCFTKFIRMLQMDDLYMRRLSVSINGKTLYVIGKQFITVFILSHTIGVIFYLIDFALVNDNIAGVICEGNNSLCWLYSATAKNDILYEPWTIQYFYSLYWGVNTITTISYGDVPPNNPYEVMYALYMMCFGFVVFGFIVNRIIRIIIWATLRKNLYRDNLIIFNTYMDQLSIPRQVQYEIKGYLQKKYLIESNRNLILEKQMQARLPLQLRLELLKSVYYDLNSHLESIFKYCPTVTEFLFYIQERKFTQNEIVLLQGASLNNFVYMVSGEVSFTCNYEQNSIQIVSPRIQNESIAFCEFLLNQKATFNVTVAKESIFYFINRQRIEEILFNNPDVNEKYKLVQYQLLIKKAYKDIFYKCFYCHGSHHWYKCSERFPDFSKTLLNEENNDIKNERIYQNSFQTLKGGKQKRTEEIGFEKVIFKMKHRIIQLKRMKNNEKEHFDVDIYYNWNTYEPNYNISNLMKQWNNRLFDKSRQIKYEKSIANYFYRHQQRQDSNL